MIEAADVAQAQLARDFVGRFEVGLQDRFLDIAPAFVAAGVDVDGDERFGFVDHDVAAAFQPDLAVKGVVDLFLHPEGFEDRRRAVVMFDPALRAPGDLADELGHAVDRRLIVADDFVDFVGEKIAHGALDEVGLLKDARGRRQLLDLLLDARPLLEEETEIAHEIAGALAFADGANDDAHAFGNFEFTQNFPQSLAFFLRSSILREMPLRSL